MASALLAYGTAFFLRFLPASLTVASQAFPSLPSLPSFHGVCIHTYILPQVISSILKDVFA